MSVLICEKDELAVRLKGKEEECAQREQKENELRVKLVEEAGEATQRLEAAKAETEAKSQMAEELAQRF